MMTTESCPLSDVLDPELGLIPSDGEVRIVGPWEAFSTRLRRCWADWCQRRVVMLDGCVNLGITTDEAAITDRALYLRSLDEAIENLLELADAQAALTA